MRKQDLLEIWQHEISVVEVRGLTYDLGPIRRWFEDVVLPLPPAWQGAYDLKNRTAPKIPLDQSGRIGFGGWSVLGPTADYGSGWLPNGDLPSWNLNIPCDFSQARTRTNICVGPMAEMIDDLESKGIVLSRARITITKPGIGLKYHSDSNYPGELIVRIQFPIISNDGVFFDSETKRWTLQDDGRVYLVNTNHMHRVENEGCHVRFNLIADVDVDRLPDFDMFDPLPNQTLENHP